MLKTLQWLPLTIRIKPILLNMAYWAYSIQPLTLSSVSQLPPSSILAPFLCVRPNKLTSISEPLFFVLYLLVCSFPMSSPASSFLLFTSQLKIHLRRLTPVGLHPLTQSLWVNTTLFLCSFLFIWERSGKGQREGGRERENLSSRLPAERRA